MNLFYITGTSSGIGFALAKLLLQDKNNIVIGISRRCNIEHKQYHHIKHDLSVPISEEIFEPVDDSFTKIVIINNAGVVGPVTFVGKQSTEDIAQNFNVNLVAPSLLCNHFIHAYKKHSSLKIIINVSSGAGKHAIESWSTYCASKSGLDMFSMVMQQEHPEFKVFSIAPGIVDTEMQEAIRQANKEDFPHLERFKSYKQNNELTSAVEVAKKFLHVIQNPENFDQVIFSVRDF